MFKTTLLLIVAGFAVLFLATAQSQSGAEEQQSFITGLDSSDWQIRYQTIERLKSIPPGNIEPTIKDKLIQLLEFETRRVWDKFEGRVPAGSYPDIGGEGFAEYYAALVGLVLNLHEQRALPALVGAASEPLTEFNSKLASYGTLVLKPVLARLHGTSDGGVQSAMADIVAQVLIKNRDGQLKPGLSAGDLENIRMSLSALLASPNRRTQFYVAYALALVPDSPEAHRIQEIFLLCLNDKTPGSRIMTLEKIGSLKEARFVPLAKLKELAEHDEFHVDLKNPALRARYKSEYPIRSLAVEVLQKLSARRRP